MTPAPETFGLLDALLHGDWTFADAATAPTRRETSGLVAAHLQWHLERQLRSLPLVERPAHAGGVKRIGARDPPTERRASAARS